MGRRFVWFLLHTTAIRKVTVAESRTVLYTTEVNPHGAAIVGNIGYWSLISTLTSYWRKLGWITCPFTAALPGFQPRFTPVVMRRPYYTTVIKCRSCWSHRSLWYNNVEFNDATMDVVDVASLWNRQPGLAFAMSVCISRPLIDFWPQHARHLEQLGLRICCQGKRSSDRLQTHNPIPNTNCWRSVNRHRIWTFEISNYVALLCGPPTRRPPWALH